MLLREQYFHTDIGFAARLKDISIPLRTLVENEIFRLAVWVNPANDPKRGTDPMSTPERSLAEV